MLVRFFSNFLGVKPAERDGVIYFFFVLLIFAFGASVARSVSMTLLVQNWGGDKLPIAFVAIDLSVMIGSLVYANYTRRVNGLTILNFFFLSTAIFTALAQSLFHFTSEWVYGFFFIGFYFFYIIIFIHVGSVIASYFTAIQIKRVTTLINTGLPIGGMLGGGTLVVLLNLFHIDPQQLPILLGIACLGGTWLLKRISLKLVPIRTSDSEVKGSQASRSAIGEWVMASKSIITSRLMLFMSLGLIVFVIGNKLLEYQYQAIIYPKVFPEETARATFFATYEIFANLAWLLVQLFITSRVIIKLGVGASNLVYPVMTAIASIALFCYFYWFWHAEATHISVVFMLSLAIFTQFINQEMRVALRTPISNLLFNAIPPHLWGSNKAFLNGLVFPFATLIAGVFLILLTGMGADSSMTTLKSVFTEQQIGYMLPSAAFIVSLLGIWIAIPQWKAYDEGVFGLLNVDLFDRRGGELSLDNQGSNLRQVLEEKLTHTDPHHVIAALEMIRMLQLDQFVNQVGNLLLKTKTTIVKQRCIEALAALPKSSTSITYLIEALRNEQDAKILPLLIKQFAEFKSVNFNNTIEKFLTHPSPAVFVEACVCLHGHPQYRRKKELERKVLNRLSDLNIPDLPLYLYALGQFREPAYVDKVLPLLEESRLEVRIAAFDAYVTLLQGQLEVHKADLVKALKNPCKEIKLTALRALKECQPLTDWAPIIQLLNARDKNIVQESKELLLSNMGSVHTTLEAYAFSELTSVQQRFEILSLIYSRFNRQQQARLSIEANKSLRQFVRVQAILRIYELVGAYKTSKVYSLIAKILREIAEQHLLHVITIITYASDQNLEFFQRVSRGLLSPDRANQGNALEVLSNAGEKYLVERVLKYYEERLNSLAAFDRIHHALFEEGLDIDENNYESHVLMLGHDLLKACLCYAQKEKSGKFPLSNLPSSVKALLVEPHRHAKQVAMRA